MSKKENMVRSPSCKFNHLARNSSKQPCLNSQLKPPKCYIKITGSRYNGTFLLNIDDGLDDAIYHTMRDIEVALEEQTDPMGKPRVSPKNCLSSVFRCFGTSDLQTQAVCNKKKPKKPANTPAECSVTATINKSDLGPLISAVQASPFNSSPYPENSSESVMREVVDVFRTTLDQFRKEKVSSVELPPSEILAEPNQPQQSTTANISKTETIDRAKQSCKELKKVAFIKFSQEEVLVIQPPKPSNNDTEELEVGIEVKPKTTASNVGQSIKLAKDKVLIGVQDGRGVLHINDGIPKRSFQMVIEEGVNGKPSMKLSLKEGNPEEKEHLIPEHNHTNGIKFQESKEDSSKNCMNNKYNGNKSISTITNSNENRANNNSFHNDIKNYKSVESQVSWARLKDMSTRTSEEQQFKSESTQCQIPLTDQSPNASHCVCCTVGIKPQTAVANGGNEFSDVPQDTVLHSPCFKRYSGILKPRDSRINRMPYLVHTLYEPRSLQNSSAYFASDNPSTHCLIGKVPNSKKLETSKRQIKKPKSLSFSSDYSSSSKRTKIFRDIGEIGVKGIRKEARPLDKEDASMTTSVVEDFEKILQSMCGPSYLYHHPQPLESKPITGVKHEQVLKSQKYNPGNMSLDQWTQTDSCNKEVRAGLVPTTKRHILKDKTSRIRESGDGSHSRILRMKARQTKSGASQRVVDSSVSTSDLEDGFSSDSSGSNKHKLVFSMYAASEDNPLARTSSGLMSGNRITGKAKSFIGEKIFAAIEDNSNQATFLGTVKSTDSFVYPACKDASRVLLQGVNNVSVVNMAIYDPTDRPRLTNITEEDLTEVKAMNEPVAMSQCDEMLNPTELDEKWNHNGTLQDATSNKLSRPTRVKSKSCQNLSITPSSFQSMKNKENRMISSQIKKLRYPHLTATNTSHTSAVCGILNFNEGEMKADDQSLGNFEKHNPGSDDALPSAIRSLLLPKQQSLVFNNNEQIPTYCCDRLGTTNPADYWGLGTFNHNENDWFTSNEAFDCVTQVALQRSLFKRTFFAMKSVRTVVTRKFSTLFRKLSFAHSEKNKKALAMTDSIVYVAIPLKKKSENLHLYPRAQ